MLSEDKLFATLDPTTRKLETEEGEQMLLTDTVGFIRKLPHHLIQAFRSTLEEAKYADMILHVVDASNPDMDAQMFTVYETLQKLQVGDKPIVTAFNKIDRFDDLEEQVILKDLRADAAVSISAKYGQGVPQMLDKLSQILKESKVLIERTFGYEQGSLVASLRDLGQVIEEQYRDDGIYVKAYVPKEKEYLFRR